MKTNKYTKFMAAVLLTGAPMLWSACTDDWNEHYDIVPDGMAEQASLYEKIKADSKLDNFRKVIEAIGGKETIDSPQQLTVWAPTNMTEEQADSVIAIFREDEAAGIKWKDNRAIKQFMQNHIALYSRPISSLTDTAIHMLNKKYMRLVGESPTKGTLDGNEFNVMEICNNGILYKTANLQRFFPNIREYTELNGLDSVATFIKSFDKYTLDEMSSVEGGVIEGHTVYLDSVTNLSNNILNRNGLIQREDSDYIFIAPTNEVWKNEFEKYQQYFQYASNVNQRDSLSNVMSQNRIFESRFFNMSSTSKHNQHPEDSLTNTHYYEHQIHNPRKNVYYDPQNTLLAGLDKVECSNGYIYIDTKGAIDPVTTFFGRNDVQAESGFNYEIPTSSDNKELMDAGYGTYYTYTYEEFPDSVWEFDEYGDSALVPRVEKKVNQEYRYVEFKAKTASNHTDITYTLPETFSNVYYNIYVVTVPGRGTDTNVKDSLSSYFTVECKAQDVNGKFVNCGNDANGNRATNNGYMLNPVKYDENSPLTGYADLKGQSNFDRAYATNATKVDTILISKAKAFDVSSYGIDKGVVTLQFKSFGPAATKVKEKVYTRSLRFDEILLVPFNTKEEAEAAAFDLDALNDVLLELNKKDETPSDESTSEL